MVALEDNKGTVTSMSSMANDGTMADIGERAINRGQWKKRLVSH